mmetsp:Transcript_22095/g.54356  ORF Transcript_22095/g.54356 Transcript_22095/m.54356 type:complete len:234 (-) Transcript_22095:104-805(-)
MSFYAPDLPPHSKRATAAEALPRLLLPHARRRPHASLRGPKAAAGDAEAAGDHVHESTAAWYAEAAGRTTAWRRRVALGSLWPRVVRLGWRSVSRARNSQPAHPIGGCWLSVDRLFFFSSSRRPAMAAHSMEFSLHHNQLQPHLVHPLARAQGREPVPAGPRALRARLRGARPLSGRLCRAPGGGHMDHIQARRDAAGGGPAVQLHLLDRSRRRRAVTGRPADARPAVAAVHR